MDVGSEIHLEFNFENVVLVDGVLPSATLWLFPDSGTDDAETEAQEKDVELLVTVRCPRQQYGTEHRVVLKWSTAVPCLSLDITLAVKRVLKFLDQRQDKYATISVEVVNISERSREEANLGDDDDGGEDICCTLEEQSTDAAAPFLFLQFVEFSDDAESSRKRRSIPQRVQPQPSYNYAACSRTELPINLLSLNIGIVFPLIVDIGLCAGGCSQTGNAQPHRQLAQLAAAVLPEQHCVPMTFESATIMLLTPSGGFEIIELYEAIIASCACR